MTLEHYWDRYAESPISVEESLDRRFGWTQYDNHGPAEELLGQPESALELGCGPGDHTAYLARKGIRATGVDLSPVQIEHADKRWPQDGAEFVCSDVLTFLAGTGEKFDAIFSNWGALWFMDPRTWLAPVREHLTDKGVLVFSCAPPVDGCYGAQGMYGNGFRGRVLDVQRWAYSPEMWEGILRNAGFLEVFAKVVEAPEPKNLGTLLVQALVV
ncbi:class I SAM-dependent methyltransferase [Streptomyces sp. ISL-96]|uniref:class I SAM-dependent methyltransferase n=1 Tax=Streptomyces sp. ISL-96 TaxID=2819191 RepID=UPI001BEC40FE|nr:class I SAM-dependent methyltransferase [Streptomyces sp. ISL-96]MBT2491703.1 class I SAM-dependent methyltransferase [Streptomyces sp. ISL-96]